MAESTGGRTRKWNRRSSKQLGGETIQTCLANARQLTQEEITALAAIARDPNQPVEAAAFARKQLVESQLRWAYRVTWRFVQTGNCNHPMINFDDCFQVACLALISAVKTFDPSRGMLSTYATLRIRAELCRYLTKYQGRAITRPDPQTLRARAGDGVDEELESAFFVAYFSELDLRDEYGYRAHQSPLDEFVSDESGADEAVRSEEEEELWRMIGKLGERERKVIELRLAGKTLWEVGELWGKTREWARQIERRAMRRLCELYGVEWRGQSFASGADAA